jgi:hypothetical protein
MLRRSTGSVTASFAETKTSRDLGAILDIPDSHRDKRASCRVSLREGLNIALKSARHAAEIR